MPPTDAKTIVAEYATPEDCRNFLGALDEPGGQEPGTFTRKLIDTMMHADPLNLSRLGFTYPAYSALVAIYKHRSSWRDAITERAKL